MEELFQELDTSDIDFKKIIKEDYEEVFDEEETDKMIGYLKDNPDMMNQGILLMFVTGARIGEVVALKHSDFEGNTFKIRRTETRFTDSEGKYVCEVKEFPKSPHKIRKTYGTILLDNHIGNNLIMGQMGHTDITCTENHYHRNRKSIDKKSQIISNIPDFMAK